MPKKLFLITFFFLSCLAKAQKEAKSPFTLNDYKKMRGEYLNAVNSGNDDIIYKDQQYYSKRKIDSVTAIKYEILKQGLIEWGTPASEITDEMVKAYESNTHVYLKQAYFTLKKKGYYFYLSNDSRLEIFTDKKLEIQCVFEKNGYKEIVKNKKYITENQYFQNGHLKITDTGLNPSRENTGISREYDANGKLLLTVNWDTEFKLSKDQAIQSGIVLGKKYLMDSYKKNNPNLNDTEIQNVIEINLKKARITAYKGKEYNKTKLWYLEYMTNGYILNVKIKDPSAQLISINQTMIIE
ncbi:hypothetical protein [Chryseobacterium sp. Mn2064]|uniref:hypothetical protein n=1 Tax=Chryseobacterium sp. Mn2064 TaxID=3395263 RepID=UPI003BEA895B